MSKFQKKVSVGQFAKKGEDYKDGDILTIANEGKQVDGDFGPRHVFLVKLPKGGEKNFTFNQTSINNMVDAYGEDSVNWVGKDVKVWLILQNVQGKMVRVAYVAHPSAEINDEGSFIIPGKTAQKDAKESSAVEDINPDDIPF